MQRNRRQCSRCGRLGHYQKTCSVIAPRYSPYIPACTIKARRKEFARFDTIVHAVAYDNILHGIPVLFVKDGSIVEIRREPTLFRKRDFLSGNPEELTSHIKDVLSWTNYLYQENYSALGEYCLDSLKIAMQSVDAIGANDTCLVFYQNQFYY
jgi:hypothetical protein